MDLPEHLALLGLRSIPLLWPKFQQRFNVKYSIDYDLRISHIKPKVNPFFIVDFAPGLCYDLVWAWGEDTQGTILSSTPTKFVDN